MGLFGKKKHLDPVNLGLAMGVTVALGTFALGLMAWLWGWGIEFAELFHSVIPNYGVSFSGTLLGAAGSFIDGFIGGALVAWFYNLFMDR
jgi:hypothetical protein